MSPPLARDPQYRERLLRTALLAGVLPAAASVGLHFVPQEPTFPSLPVHELVELICGFTAVSAAALMLVRRPPRPSAVNLWCGCGLLMMGILSVFHGFSTPAHGFVWLRTLSTLSGGVLFALVWLGDERVSGRTAEVLPGCVTAAATILGAGVMAARPLLPATGTDGFSAWVIGLHLLAGALYLAAAAALIFRVAAEDAEKVLVLFACSLVFAIASVSHGASRIWDVEWWASHGLRLAAYVTLARYALGQYRKTWEQLERSLGELAASSRYARELLEASLDPLVTISKEGKVMDVNQATEEVTGCTRQELVGSDFCDYFTDPEEARRGYQRVFEAGTVRDYPLAIRHGGGRVTDVLYNATVFRNPKGEVAGVLAAARDITERKRAEQELEQRAALLQLAPAAIIVRDLESRVTYWSRGAEDLYGWPAEEARGRITHELLGTEFPEALPVIEARMRSAERWEGELRHARRDGTPLAVTSRWALQRDPEGRPCGILEINVDISERKRAETELHRLNRALRALSRCTNAVARAAGEGALLREVCQTVVQEGGYPLAWVGYAENDAEKSVRPVAVAGQGADYVRQARITWADSERGRGPTGTAIRSGVPCYVREITADPRFTPWQEAALRHGYASVIAIPLLEAGRSFGALNIYAPEVCAFEGEEYALMVELASTLAHGILALRARRERDRAAAELRDLNETLERRVAQRTAELSASTEEMESFTYSVSHDLRAPLRHIDGFSKVLLEQCGEQLDDMGRHYLERVRAGTQQMGQLIDDLLNLSRLGRCALQLRPTALGPLVQELVEELQPETAGRAVEWRIAALPMVSCDRRLIRQVLFNLLSNALKFSRGRAPAVIEMGTRGAEVFVRDNGVGFDPQYAGKLFGVFQRLHRSEDFPGTGVGLATVRRILRKHGGDIRAEAEPGAGAAFYFTLGTPDGTGESPAWEECHAA